MGNKVAKAASTEPTVTLRNHASSLAIPFKFEVRVGRTLQNDQGGRRSAGTVADRRTPVHLQEVDTRPQQLCGGGQQSQWTADPAETSIVIINQQSASVFLSLPFFISSVSFRGCTWGGVYVPCIYSHAR